MAQPFLLNAENISYTPHGTPVLDHVSLTITAGEILTLIGPNGAGKTSLLQLLLGLAHPTTGTIHRKPGLKLGYVPQSAQINPYLPIRVRHFLSEGLTGTSRHDILHEMGLEGLLDHPLQTLSGGEWQRTLLARALLRQPDLLVLDEPVQGVDMQGQLHLYSYLEKINQTTGCAILLVSHDLHFVMASSARVICLNRHICCEGRPDQIRGTKAFSDLFGEKVALSLAHYTHHHDHAHDWESGKACEHDHG